MSKIVYKKINYHNIDDHFMNGYVRFQETTHVFVKEDHELKVKKVNFVDDWNDDKLIAVSRELKDTVQKGGVVYAAYDEQQIVGFASLDTSLFFDEYMNMPYIHASRSYRGQKIGRYLFHLIALEASKQGAKKLYISSHPSVESQMFYKAMQCRQAEKIHQEIYAHEPYDIQLEYSLNPVSDAIKLLDIEFSLHAKISSIVLNKLLSKMYRYMPLKDKDFLEVCHYLLMCNTRHHFGMGTLLIKKRRTVLNEKNMEFFVSILQNYIQGWGQVDQYCYRVMNPMIELKDEYYNYLLKWSDSSNKDIRRASLVAMIRSSKGLKVFYDFEKMIFIVEKLKNDPDIHVRKAVGWVLKCSYFNYPKQLEAYLRDNVENLDRLIFRYALEHVKEPLRQELMSL